MTQTQLFWGERKEYISTVSYYSVDRLTPPQCRFCTSRPGRAVFTPAVLACLVQHHRPHPARWTGGGGTAQPWGGGSIACPWQFLEDILVRCSRSVLSCLRGAAMLLDASTSTARFPACRMVLDFPTVIAKDTSTFGQSFVTVFLPMPDLLFSLFRKWLGERREECYSVPQANK